MHSITVKLLCQSQPPLTNKGCRILKLLWISWKHVAKWDTPPRWVCDAMEENCHKRFTPTRHQRSHLTPRYKCERTYSSFGSIAHCSHNFIYFFFSILLEEERKRSICQQRLSIVSLNTYIFQKNIRFGKPRSRIVKVLDLLHWS